MWKLFIQEASLLNMLFFHQTLFQNDSISSFLVKFSTLIFVCVNFQDTPLQSFEKDFLIVLRLCFCLSYLNFGQVALMPCLNRANLYTTALIWYCQISFEDFFFRELVCYERVRSFTIDKRMGLANLFFHTVNRFLIM